MALPEPGWLTTPAGAPVTRFPLPAPILGVYREGTGDPERPYPAPVLTVLASGGGSARASASLGAAGTRAQRIELRMDEAFGVVLVDTISGTPFYAPCALPGVPEAGTCETPAQPEWE